jgi:hypothetical protein
MKDTKLFHKTVEINETVASIPVTFILTIFAKQTSESHAVVYGKVGTTLN